MSWAFQGVKLRAYKPTFCGMHVSVTHVNVNKCNRKLCRMQTKEFIFNNNFVIMFVISHNFSYLKSVILFSSNSFILLYNVADSNNCIFYIKSHFLFMLLKELPGTNYGLYGLLRRLASFGRNCEYSFMYQLCYLLKQMWLRMFLN